MEFHEEWSLCSSTKGHILKEHLSRHIYWPNTQRFQFCSFIINIQAHFILLWSLLCMPLLINGSFLLGFSRHYFYLSESIIHSTVIRYCRSLSTSSQFTRVLHILFLIHAHSLLLSWILWNNISLSTNTTTSLLPIFMYLKSYIYKCTSLYSMQ